jgi:hypothetical protein
MSIDSRLRDGLRRSMSKIDTDAELRLTDARRHGRRRLLVRRAGAAFAVAATIAIVVVAGPTILGALHGRGPEPATSPTALPITGTYTTSITTEDATGVPAAEGTWLMTLGGDGSLHLASLTNGDLGSSATQYQATPNEFLTTAFDGSRCSGLGRYTWVRSGSSLTVAVVSDPCPLRVAILSSHPWRTA